MCYHINHCAFLTCKRIYMYVHVCTKYAVLMTRTGLQVKQMNQKDSRIKLVNEVLNGIKASHHIHYLAYMYMYMTLCTYTADMYYMYVHMVRVKKNLTCCCVETAYIYI